MSNLLLKNIRLYTGTSELFGDLRIRRGKIQTIANSIETRRNEKVIDLSGYIGFPGLINSHDHLEMNLFPHLGNPPYSNFYDWADSIYKPELTPLKEILQVPIEDRLWWGGYKNLISGVTTVVHHNPFYRKVFNRKFPVKVLRKYNWSHSIGHGNDLRKTYLRKRHMPYIIHAAEGIDLQSTYEITQLENLGLLSSNSVIIHGVGLRQREIEKLVKARAHLVWCPASNLRLFGKTAPINQIKNNIRLALGTDSTMSGSPTLLDELRIAHKTGMATQSELVEMVTITPRLIFHLKNGAGILKDGVSADLFLIPDEGDEITESLLMTTPGAIAFVMVNGKPRLANPFFAEILGLGKLKVSIEGKPKWIYGDISKLMTRIQGIVGTDIITKNPVWNLIELLH